MHATIKAKGSEIKYCVHFFFLARQWTTAIVYINANILYMIRLNMFSYIKKPTPPPVLGSISLLHTYGL